VLVPATDETVATGAAVQAAAVLTGQPPEDVAVLWGLGGGSVVAPRRSVDAAARRAAYAAAARC
jgi:xylulokinase